MAMTATLSKKVSTFFLIQMLQKNQVNIETASISSDCDGVEYNNTDCIQMMHEGINPSLLLKNVVKDKNMQYEIF
jgi:hypothetical protein